MICKYGTFVETFRKTEVNPSESFEVVGVELPKIKNQIKIEKDKNYLIGRTIKHIITIQI